MAESLGLGELLGRKPKDLSGGQQQRVAIGRAIIREPSVFLFDEPLSNLDAKLRVETRTELLQIQRRLGITCLYVTHDQEEAMTLSDRMVVMRDGRTAQEGTPLEVYNTPGRHFRGGVRRQPEDEPDRRRAHRRNLHDRNVVSPCRRTQSTPPARSRSACDPTTCMPTPPTASEADAQVKLIELLGPRAIVTHRRRAAPN